MKWLIFSTFCCITAPVFAATTLEDVKVKIGETLANLTSNFGVIDENLKTILPKIMTLTQEKNSTDEKFKDTSDQLKKLKTDHDALNEEASAMKDTLSQWERDYLILEKLYDESNENASTMSEEYQELKKKMDRELSEWDMGYRALWEKYEKDAYTWNAIVNSYKSRLVVLEDQIEKRDKVINNTYDILSKSIDEKIAPFSQDVASNSVDSMTVDDSEDSTTIGDPEDYTTVDDTEPKNEPQ